MRKKSYTLLARDVIHRADVVLEILDARLIQETRNLALEREVISSGRRLIHVINKSDLAPREFLEKAKDSLTNAIFISTKERDGISMLRQLIYRVAAASKSQNEDIVVGVVGYPNVGKSSIINALAGRASTGVSPVSGYTRSVQKVRVTNRIMILDSPGVIPVDEQDQVKLAIIASKNADSLEAPDFVAAQILLILLEQHGPEWFETTFGVVAPVPKPPVVTRKSRLTKLTTDQEPGKEMENQTQSQVSLENQAPQQIKDATYLLDTIDEIAIVRKRLRKGGVPDTLAMARQIIMDWQRGKFEIVRKTEHEEKKDATDSE